MDIRKRHYKDFKTYEITFHYTEAEIRTGKYTQAEREIIRKHPTTPTEEAEKLLAIAKGIARANS